MKPEECPKFRNCSAPVCPAFDDWEVHGHLCGERVCAAMRNIVKEGGDEAVAEAFGPAVKEVIAQRVDLVRLRFPDIDRSLSKAAASAAKTCSWPASTPGAKGTLGSA